MKSRQLWIDKVKALWLEKGIIWLSGVRRVGKTCLCRQLPDAVFMNCDLPSVRNRLEDPEFFFKSHEKENHLLILDEVHRIKDPSLLLKIAADEFPQFKILATGSSTLHASRKFRDTLTDRKRSLHLVPVLWRECLEGFDVWNFDRRLLHGGLPGQLLSPAPDPEFFEDWMNSFYARDIQELFGIRNRTAFLTLFQLLCRRSGGQLSISDLANLTGVSRPTVMSHLDAMEIAHAICRIQPYHGGSSREIICQPRVYVFDTGIIAHVRGWRDIRDEDRGHLWEHLVLDELRMIYPARLIHYWRNKSQNEIDFVIDRGSGEVDTVEAKINPTSFSSRSLAAFRNLHPNGRNFIVCPFIDSPYPMSVGGFTITVCRPDHLPSTAQAH